MHVNVLVYIVLGVALGLLYRWAFDASKFYKKFIEDNAPGRNRFPLLSKIASIASAAAALISSMVIIGADRHHSWIKLALFLVIWVLTTLAANRVAPVIRK